MADAGDSYCATTDVEARTQIGAFGAGTIPTLAQVLDFQAQRAGDLYLILRREMGDDAVGPANYANSIDGTASDQEKALEFVLIEYNAIGAAFDALEAAGASEEPARSERVAELWAMWQTREVAVSQAAQEFLGDTTRSATHISVGEITEATVTSREEDGLGFNGRTVF
jgi:hypothetical protein